MAKAVVRGEYPKIVEAVLSYAKRNDDLFWIVSLVPETLGKNGLILDGDIAGVVEKLSKIPGTSIK